MDHAEHLGSPAAALGKALDSYAEWLDCRIACGIDEADRGDSGTSLLHSVAEIRRTHCPGAGQFMTDLLLAHTKLSALLFEHQLKLVRGEPTEPLIKSNECISLIQRQIATIAAMRAACLPPQGLCLNTGPTVKNAAPKFATRSASLADPGHLQA